MLLQKKPARGTMKQTLRVCLGHQGQRCRQKIYCGYVKTCMTSEQWSQCSVSWSRCTLGCLPKGHR